MRRRMAIAIALIFGVGGLLFAEDSGGSIELHLAHLIIQIVLILAAGKMGGDLASWINLPRPLGQLVMGILISPHFLGGTYIGLFDSVLFPINELSSDVPVTNEIYLLSTLAYVILLFMAGLDTNISLFLRYFVKGSVIGFVEVGFAFFGTLFFASWYFGLPLLDPIPLFIAVFVTPTSVAIMAEVLSRSRKLGSPEGVIIITSAVLDDILGIILLSVAMGLVAFSAVGGGEAITVGAVFWVVIKSLSILAIFSAISLYLSKRTVRLMKSISSQDNSYIAVLALVLAFVTSVAMQMAGLSLIVGAYITGLAFSNTEIKFMLREKLQTIESLFVPLFFVVMGMFVDIQVLLAPSTMILGLIFSLFAIAIKVVGNGLPAYFLGFNTLGATRIGFGMVPHGEMTLIIASTALGLNLINPQIFAMAVAVTFLPSLLTAPVIAVLFKSNRSGTSENQVSNDKELFYQFPSPELTKLVCWELQTEYEEEGYYVYPSKIKSGTVYQVRKDSTFFTFAREHNSLTFRLAEDDIFLIKTFLYEVLLKLTDDLGKVKGLFNRQDLAKSIENGSSMTNRAFRGTIKYFRKDRLIFLKSHDEKNDVIRELVETLPEDLNHNKIYEAVLTREKQYTTGMPGGLALPHARVEGLEKTEVVIGISPEGINFHAMDDKPSFIFVLIVSPLDGEGLSSHLEVMAQLSNFLNPHKMVFQELIQLKNSSEVLVHLKNLKNVDILVNTKEVKEEKTPPRIHPD